VQKKTKTQTSKRIAKLRNDSGTLGQFLSKDVEMLAYVCLKNVFVLNFGR